MSKTCYLLATASLVLFSYGFGSLRISSVHAQAGRAIYGSVVSDAPPDLAFTQRFDYDVNGRVIYKAWADSAISGGPVSSAASWSIMKYTYDVNGRVTLIQWANGSSKANQIWDNRASLSFQ